MDETKIAEIMRLLYGAFNPEFEDVGQPISQMRFLDKHYELNLEEMAFAVLKKYETAP